MNKAYIINFDIDNTDSFDYESFHQSLTTVKGVISWWHHLQCSYIIIVSSNIPAASVSDYIMKIMPEKLFFVCELNLNNHNGWLPQEAWDWINKNK